MNVGMVVKIIYSHYSLYTVQATTITYYDRFLATQRYIQYMQCGLLMYMRRNSLAIISVYCSLVAPPFVLSVSALSAELLGFVAVVVTTSVTKPLELLTFSFSVPPLFALVSYDEIKSTILVTTHYIETPNHLMHFR